MKKSDGNGRPIKVTLSTSEAVRQVLNKAKVLKSSVIMGDSFSFNKLYLSPDSSVELEKICRREKNSPKTCTGDEAENKRRP